jgi:hypothetical protein
MPSAFILLRGIAPRWSCQQEMCGESPSTSTCSAALLDVHRVGCGHWRFRRCSSHIGWRWYRRVSPGRNALLISSFISDFTSCGVDFDLCCLYTWVHVFTVRTSTSALGSVNHDEMGIQGYLILCFQYRSWTLLNLLIFWISAIAGESSANKVFVKITTPYKFCEIVTEKESIRNSSHNYI